MPRFQLSRWVFLRLLGLTYLAAFASLTPQIIGLVGADGLLPAAEYLERAKEFYGADAYVLLPTLGWISAGDGVLLGLCWGGIVLSALAVAGIAPVPTFWWFCCNVWDHARESVGWTSLHGQSEHLVDQPRLTDHVALRHPPRLPLAERMHYLDTADGPPRRGEPLEPQHRPGTAFDESMVLLDDVVQILALAERRTWSEKSLVFDGLERDRVSGVLVHVHDARGRRMRRTDRLAEERDGRIPVARGPEPEIQRVTVGINAPVKIVPGPADTHVRLVDSIRIRGASQKWPAPLVDLRRIALHPSIDRRMVDTQAPLAHHFLEVAVTQIR